MVRTRIAPSPTGFPHIGTMYQALFDFAFSKKNDGHFIVRIEDTDQKRFVEGAEAAVYHALDWFTLPEDESPRKGGEYGPYKQSERLSLYKEHAKELVNKNYAYYCDCTPERLEEVRNKLQKAGKIPMYDKYCRALKKTTGVIRLKVPENEKVSFKDEIRGEIVFDTSTIDDQVILKSDGFPTYHLAVVVDDHCMKISHVVRSEEWITSTPKHVLLYRYFGWEMPLWYHTSALRNPDHSKMSKRHGHTNVSWYQEHGYLPKAILNYLALLGWSHPEEKEVFSLSEFIERFDLKDIKPAGPIFDLAKLSWLNGHYIREMDIDDLVSQLREFWKTINNKEYEVFHDEELKKIVVLAKSRMNTLEEFTALTSHFLHEPEFASGDEKGELVQAELFEVFSKLENWNKDDLFIIMKAVMQKHGVKMPMLYMLLTGNKSGLPLPESIEILGKEKTLKRLQHGKL